METKRRVYIEKEEVRKSKAGSALAARGEIRGSSFAAGRSAGKKKKEIGARIARKTDEKFAKASS